MRDVRIARSLLVAVVLWTLAIVAPSTVQADEHLVIVEVEMEDEPGAPAPCPVSTVVVSATSCALGAIAGELEGELDDEGLAGGVGTPVCEPHDTIPDTWQCVYSIPANCDQVRNRVTVEVGSDCPEDILIGRSVDGLGIFGVILFGTE